MERQKAATRRTRCFSLVALGNTKFPPAFVWVRDFFPLNLFSVEFKTMSMKHSPSGLLWMLYSLCSYNSTISCPNNPITSWKQELGPTSFPTLWLCSYNFLTSFSCSQVSYMVVLPQDKWILHLPDSQVQQGTQKRWTPCLCSPGGSLFRWQNNPGCILTQQALKMTLGTWPGQSIVLKSFLCCRIVRVLKWS